MLRLKDLKKKDGVTLIELVVALAIVTLVAGSIILILVSGMNVFSSGSSQYDIQGNARMASQLITEEIRYAVDLEIIQDITSVNLDDIPVYVNYLYYDGEKVVKVNKFDIETKYIGNGGSLNFWSESGDKILRYNIFAEDSSRVYNIENEVNSLNLHLGDSNSIIVSYDGGTVLKYVDINDYISSTQLPVVKIGDTNNDQAVELVCNKSISQVEVIDQNTKTADPDDESEKATPIITGSNTLDLTFTESVKNNRSLIIQVEFYEVDGPVTYAYTLTYSNSDLWTITD